MKANTEAIVAQDAATIQRAQPTIIDIINKLTDSPELSLQAVEALTQLVALQDKHEARARKEAFDRALAECQAEMPRIAQNGLIDLGKGKISYAKLEDIDACIRPIYSAKGFSVRYNAPVASDGGKIRIVAIFSCAGHSEEMEVTLGPDTGPGRNAAQAVMSAIAYGRRHLLKMFFNIIEEGADKNGAKTEDVECISRNEALDITTRMNDLPQKEPGTLLRKLCALYGVARIEDLRVRDLQRAIKVVEDSERRHGVRS